MTVEELHKLCTDKTVRKNSEWVSLLPVLRRLKDHHLFPYGHAYTYFTIRQINFPHGILSSISQ
jgi:hypothetical protein